MDQPTRANYALLTVQEHLGDSADGLDVSWAEFVGNHRSSEFEFTVPRVDVYKFQSPRAWLSPHLLVTSRTI
jgi:hypothetical protein